MRAGDLGLVAFEANRKNELRTIGGPNDHAVVGDETHGEGEWHPAGHIALDRFDRRRALIGIQFVLGHGLPVIGKLFECYRPGGLKSANDPISAREHSRVRNESQTDEGQHAARQHQQGRNGQDDFMLSLHGEASHL
jgi:hypothetical protein